MSFRMRGGMRRSFRRRPMGITQSVKNQLETKATQVPAVNNIIVFANAVEPGIATKVLGDEVPVGAKIFSMQVTVQAVSTTGGSTGSFDWYIAKVRGQQQTSTEFPDPDWSAIGLSQVRNQIFHCETNLFGTKDAGPVKFNRRIKIPKIYQRVRAGDRIAVVAQSSVASDILIGAVYKYYM